MATGTGDRVTQGDILSDLGPGVQAKKQRTSSGAAQMALGVAKVVTVNEEEYTLTLREVLGSDQEFQRHPVSMTFPGAGKRHFLGAMPDVGDMCLIGRLAQETDGRTTTPVILGWILPGTWLGHDWMVSQPFAPDEYSMDPKDSQFVAGAFERTRHKLRHMEAGNIVASSSQGSDLVLDEGVLLTNRRCNEIRLRDQDQAFIVRACQHYSAMSGTRVYSGMVHREGTFLPTQVISDNIAWTGPNQFNNGENRPYTDEELRAFPSSEDVGSLLPEDVFNRRQEDGTLGDDNSSGVFFEPNIDPYEFLQRGLFITEDGKTYDGRTQSDAVYGGKPLYRVSAVNGNDGLPLNAMVGVGDQSRSFTEHRVEVAHTSDGRLPVTEQTDDFDADRIPRSKPTNLDRRGRSSQAPFVEHVMGTVVGNDPFSADGREKYGLPLKPVIFEGEGSPAPSLESGLGSPIGSHAAFLFQMVPPLENPGPPTFSTVTKDGRFLASVGGTQAEDFSAEVAFLSGLRMSTGGVMRFEAGRGFEFKSGGGDSASNTGLNLASDTGSVRVYGGGNSKASTMTNQTAPTGDGEGDAPSLLLEGRNNTLVKASRKVSFKAGQIESKSTSNLMEALNGLVFRAGDQISQSSKTFDHVVNGKATYSYQGPKDNLPTSGPFRETTFTGIGIDPVDKYTVLQGDREEEFLLGNHTTSILVGDLTYETAAGKWKASAGTNELSVDVGSGLKASVLVGNINMEAIAGSGTISAQVALTLKTTGQATLSGTAGVTLGGPGKVGQIVCSSDLDPLTGLPLASFGMGSPGHSLGPAI